MTRVYAALSMLLAAAIACCGKGLEAHYVQDHIDLCLLDRGGATQVQYRYKSVTIQVQHRYNLGTIQARYRYNTGSVNCNTGATKDVGGTLWYIVQWTIVRTKCYCQQKAIYLYSLPICFCSLSTLALHTPSLSQVEKRPTILQIKLPFMHFKQCKNRFLVYTSVPGAWTEPDLGT